MNAHDGHRARKRELFLKAGLDAFSDHEALELLLYYAVPRVDTNPLAHRLLERFGSLEYVLSAPAEVLEQVEGMGRGAAALVSLIFPLSRRAHAGVDTIVLNSSADAGAYFSELFFGMREERLYEACLDAKGRLLRCAAVARGGPGTADVELKSVADTALACNAFRVVLAHNHPGGAALPSEDDKNTTILAWEALRETGVELLDHIIVADGGFVSLRDNGFLPPPADR